MRRPPTPPRPNLPPRSGRRRSVLDAIGKALLTAVLAVLVVLVQPAWLMSPACAQGVEVVEAQLEQTDDGVRLEASFSLELHRGLEDALVRGVPLYFTTEVEIGRERWYWFDERAVTASRTVRISYNVLTRQYHAGVVGQLQQSFPTLDDALLLVRRPSRWIVAPPGTLKPGVTYDVTVKMGLDVTQLPKPFQVHALNSSDWRLSSDRLTFSFKAEKR